MSVKTCQCYCWRQIDKNFPWRVILTTVKMTSKCSKLCSETTRLRLVAPLHFDVTSMADRSTDHGKLLSICLFHYPLSKIPATWDQFCYHWPSTKFHRHISWTPHLWGCCTNKDLNPSEIIKVKQKLHSTWDAFHLRSFTFKQYPHWFSWQLCLTYMCFLQMENVRFVRLALYQGKAKKAKAAVTMVMTPINKMAIW